MIRIVAAILGCALVGLWAFAGDEPDHLAKLKALAAGGSVESSPRAMEYLKSLTKQQTLTALRQLGKDVEAERPVDTWPELGLAVGVLMKFYPEPMRRADLSDEEFRTMRPSKKRDLEAGLIPKALMDEAFDKVVAGIANRKEGAFFRYALAGYLEGDLSPGPETLTQAQRDRLIDTYLSVLSDRESPLVVRKECHRSAVRVLADEYSRIIHSDPAVKQVPRVGPPHRGHNIDALIASGQIALSRTNSEQLACWREWMGRFRRTVRDLQGDEREPACLRELAKTTMSWIERDPRLTPKPTPRPKL